MAPIPPAPPEAEQLPAVLTAVRIAEYARAAGFRDDNPSNDPGQRHSELAVAVAIALAESGGHWAVVNPIGATGLWQIYPGNENLKDPSANATAAYNKYVNAGHRFTPWTTFNNKVYLPFLVRAEAAVKKTHRDRPGFTGGGEGFVHDVIAFTGDLPKDLATFFSFLTSGQTWLRLGEGILGGILLILALVLLVTQTRTGRAIKGAVT